MSKNILKACSSYLSNSFRRSPKRFFTNLDQTEDQMSLFIMDSEERANIKSNYS